MEEKYKKLSEILLLKGISEVRSFDRKNRSFVHYTSAESAFKILTSKEIWMRDSSFMNDLSEVEHGLSCLYQTLSSSNSTGKNFQSALSLIDPNLGDELFKILNIFTPSIRNSSYILSLSEHLNNDEDQLGRLSMWRAYGGDCGVALVLNPDAVLSETDLLHAYISKAEYLDHSTFGDEFKEMTLRISQNADFIKSNFTKDEIHRAFFQMMRFAVLYVKHPGFKEELEWRLLYSPFHRNSQYVTEKKELIRGIPQLVQAIPLGKDGVPSLNIFSIPNLIRRIIVGPNHNARNVAEVFKQLLLKEGVLDAETKVWCSNIPLRT